MKAPEARIRAFILLTFALLLSSCSSNGDNPVAPPSSEHPVPNTMVRIVGTPHVKVNFDGSLLTVPGSPDLAGSFSVIMTDSIGRRTFVNDVRLGGVPMHPEVDPLGSPARYTLNTSEIPGLAIGDSLVFEVVDGGDVTPPFRYEMLPSYLTLPVGTIHENQDYVLPWTGAVERVLVTFTDRQGKRVRFNLQVENYSGMTSLFVRGSDLAGLVTGDVSLGTDVLDTENFVSNGAFQQFISMETRQSLVLSLQP